MPKKRKRVRFADADEVGEGAGGGAEEGAADDEYESANKKEKLEPKEGDIREGKDEDEEGEEKEDDEPEYESKHTLESDEEDEEKYKRLDIDRIDGQEEATTEFEGETKITPFNMREEMEEGHFDSTGNFIFDKQGEEIKDAWLDNIDWGRVKKDAGDEWLKEQEQEESAEPVDQLQVYTAILSFLKPSETITKALRRLGGNRSATAVRQERWKLKKSQKSAAEGDAAATSAPSEVTQLTELVDKLVSEGAFEVYGYTYEKLKHEVDKRQNLNTFKDSANGGANDDDQLDIFAANIDEQKLKSTDTPETKKETETLDLDKTMWEFRWENVDSAKIHGPSSSEEMQKWAEEGYFKEGVWARKVGSDTFYSTKRIDFDLYT